MIIIPYSNMRNWLTFILIAVLLALGTAPVAEAGRGCCSWHGGQNYCDTDSGRWVCRDGTYSPTCRCSYIPPKPKVDSCSIQGLYDQYVSRKAKGESMAGLSTKSWWKKCPQSVRQEVYDRIHKSVQIPTTNSSKDNAFSKKQDCQKLISSIKQKLKDTNSYPVDGGFGWFSILDKVFYSEDRNSCLYTTNIYGFYEGKTVMSYGLYDGLSDEIIKIVNMDGTKAENDQRITDFFQVLESLGG